MELTVRLPLVVADLQHLHGLALELGGRALEALAGAHTRAVRVLLGRVPAPARVSSLRPHRLSKGERKERFHALEHCGKGVDAVVQLKIQATGHVDATARRRTATGPPRLVSRDWH